MIANYPVRAERMRQALVTKRQSYDDLVTVSGMSKVAVQRWVKQMRSIEAVHVEDWGDDTRGRKFVPLFRWGKKPDAERPGRTNTAARRMRDMRARRRAEKEAAC